MGTKPDTRRDGERLRARDPAATALLPSVRQSPRSKDGGPARPRLQDIRHQREDERRQEDEADAERHEDLTRVMWPKTPITKPAIMIATKGRGSVPKGGLGS